MSRHTPGPWTVMVYAKQKYAVIKSAEGELATIDLQCMPDAEADARLIAAAPDLLAACEALVRIAEQTNTVSVPQYVRTVTVTFDPATLIEARAAIAKARGEK